MAQAWFTKQAALSHGSLIACVEKGDLEGVKAALAREVALGKDSREVVNNQTGGAITAPIHLACEKGHLQVVQFLLAEGASPAQEDRVRPGWRGGRPRFARALMGLDLEAHCRAERRKASASGSRERAARCHHGAHRQRGS